MRFSVHVYNFTLPGEPDTLGPTLAETARTAEQIGADAVTLMDHWFQMENVGRSEDPMLEGYTSLGFLAGVTERVKLGLLVTGVTYRHPGLLAKTVTTLDVLSGGRAILGLGAAWYEREHHALGVPYPPLGERFERLEETLQIVHQMWSDDDGPYEGKHYQLAETICQPQPIQKPHPPIMIGGQGEKKTLRLVAQYGDACNLFPIGVDGIKHKLEVLERHCEDVGRDPAEIHRTMLPPGDPVADPDAFLSQMEQYAALGIETVSVQPEGPDPVRWVTEFGEKVAPRLAEIG
ncbi:LLM class F420-dependent oxidoreductase [Aeromicrobium duanguangcaii]|uniref:TIGR03560 family F420-dependent LLM class oxidoreductase n=1 Tax=Aeromicrobium duanguangcaii TaxID=2968086 RepID=A0ABY5KF55_9ACTN|nr:LLM class F420-dependent oxidoreductase [Aeromicrobium duanguangcaii]MCD9154264.1 TIGR03560 family F420-dependent LLM class oxidoreductase [Aeromicrobium duanguangcaii]UUI68668.1 TIGR03560 family F420-dependent LLM class oxidoreductase [Aeromicrobium duanguangcaii]